MENNQTVITEGNIYSWLCSTGYLLPSTELELNRFELLYPRGSVQVNAEKIDPFAILNGTRQRNPLSINVQTSIDISLGEELRMAARKHNDLPQDIIDRIKKNQERSNDNDQHDTPKDL